MGKSVLVKTLSQHKMSSWRELENFESESQILQRLRRVQLGTPFIVESLDDNGNLHQIQVLLLIHSLRIDGHDSIHNIQLHHKKLYDVSSLRTPSFCISRW